MKVQNDNPNVPHELFVKIQTDTRPIRRGKAIVSLHLVIISG
jgi:hypothetical protein